MAPPPLLMFVGGQPDRDDESEVPPSFVERLASIVSPRLIRKPPDPSDLPAGPVPWYVPGYQMMCVEMVVEIAEPMGQAVKVVDVNLPGDDRELVEEFVGSSDVLPILVRPDRKRLEGLESFRPSRLKEFLSQA